MAIADKQYAFASSTGKMADLEYRPARAVRDTCIDELVEESPVTVRRNTGKLYDLIMCQRDLIASVAAQIGVPITPMDVSNLPAENLSTAIDSLITVAGVNNEYLMAIRETLG